MKTLDRYRSNVFSQNGEDGVIKELLTRLSLGTGVCVEFGAWDGKHLSNTFNLVTQGWKAVYIEGDGPRFRDLEATVREHPQITPIHSFVGLEGAKRLDALLAPTGISRDFDLLSIDIDSFDWQVWESLREFQPKIVVIEINSSLRPGIRQVHEAGKAPGSSFTSTLELGLRKGYRLACHTGNMIFVREDLIDRVGLSDSELAAPEMLFDYRWVTEHTPLERAVRKFRRAMGVIRSSG